MLDESSLTLIDSTSEIPLSRSNRHRRHLHSLDVVAFIDRSSSIKSRKLSDCHSTCSRLAIDGHTGGIESDSKSRVVKSIEVDLSIDPNIDSSACLVSSPLLEVSLLEIPLLRVVHLLLRVGTLVRHQLIIIEI